MSEESKKRNIVKESSGILDASFRSGRVSGDVYLNPTKNGQMFSTSIYASYQDKDGNWQRSTSFKPHELLQVGSVARRAHDHCEQNRNKSFYREGEAKETEAQKTAATAARKHKERGMEMSR